MSFFQWTRPEVKIESFLTTGREKEIDSFSVGFNSHCNTVFETRGCFATSVAVKKYVPLSLNRIFNVVARRELDALRRHYTQEKSFSVIGMWDCEWWRPYKTTNTVEQRIREHFPYRCPLAAEQLLEEKKKGKLFGYVQCDIEVLEKLKSKLDNFPSIFKNTLVSENNIGDLMKHYANEERLMSQPRKIMISSFTLQTGTVITPLLLFSLQLGLVWTKLHPFLAHSKEMLQKLCSVSSGCKKARWGKSKFRCRRRNKEASSQQLLRLRDHGLEPKHSNEVHQWQKTHAATNSIFKKLDCVSISFNEVKLAKAQVEH